MIFGCTFCFNLLKWVEPSCEVSYCLVLQEKLGDVVFVELPEIGQEFSKGGE